jgi:hypothetical protein
LHQIVDFRWGQTPPCVPEQRVTERGIGQAGRVLVGC